MITSSIWDQIGHPTLLVLGDLILDRYVTGSCNRISQEAAVPVLHTVEQEVRLGGAVAVANLARGLGANVLLAGIVGEDAEANQIRKIWGAFDLQPSLLLVDPTRPTTVKQRFLTRTPDGTFQHHLRVDTEQTHQISPSLEKEFLGQVKSQLDRIGAILLSDYDKGVLTPHLVQGIIEAAQNREVPVLIDPARMNSFSKYRGATLITPNRVETERAVGFSLCDRRNILSAGHLLRKQYQLESVLITLDRDGLALVTSDVEKTIVPTRPRKVCDVAGAGDMVLAVAGLGLAAKLSWPEILELANTAAGLEVERQGVTPITREEISIAQPLPHSDTSKLASLEQLEKLVCERRRDGRTIVLTNGCFDLFHIGHLRTLEEAAAQGDILIVAINSNESVKKLKGPMRPVIEENQRAQIIAALECVDHVLVFDEDTPHRLLEAIRPDVLVKGGSTKDVVGREIVDAYRGRMHITSEVPNLCTSQLIALIRGSECDSSARSLIACEQQL